MLGLREGAGMKIPAWAGPKDQYAHIGRHKWAVSRLIELSRNFPVMEIPLNHLNVYCKYNGLTLREMAMHMKAVDAADLSFPIILDEDGELMDGRHRIIKAMITNAETIKAVRFDENPSPCIVEE